MLLRQRLFVFVGLLAPILLNAQSPVSQLPGTNVERLLEMAREFRAQEIRERAEAEAFAREHGLPIRLEDSLETIEIRRIENGIPHYYSVDNITAAYTLNTDDLWNGGSLGINIEGQNMIVGEWDGGGVLTTHQEFMPAGGGASRAIQQDWVTTSNYHATHVAGTLIAEGQVAAAKGMAHKATLHAYDWNNDNSEMATAAANGLLISNHSYGTVAGWRHNSSSDRDEWWGNPSQTQDYRFGQYNEDASHWDGIAYNAPYYLIVKSAGNDRGDSGTDPHYIYSGGNWVVSSQPASFREIDGGPDGYDCIPTNGNAKNILTVGAVGDIATGWSQASDVVMSSFSGWGPTDDGRIKPDVVGNGIGLYSTYNTNTSSYQSLNGTSMAAPNVTGSLILLQQLHMDSVGSYMRAATLKGLTIHTANEAGANPGPDYANGWGLVDMNRAAQVILDSESNSIVETTLSNGGTYTLSFVSDGTTPVSATICWTDPAPAGFYQSSTLNDATSRLVNDLDVVITNGSTTYQPWILDPANPANPATTGDNIRDNVEKIEAGVIPAGNYVVQVTHKGSLTSGPQAFSLILSGRSGVPSAGFSVSESYVCQGDVVTLTDASTGGATSYAWSISPATGWSFANGTNANSQNPQISVSASSEYFSVTQTVSNSFGSSSTTSDSVIKVGGYELPYFNDLETEQLRNELTINNPDGDTTWSFVSNSVNTTTLKMNNYWNDNTGTMDWVILPRLDLTQFSSAQLEFDYAYTIFPGHADTLLVAVSNGCGNTIYAPVFYSGGTQLATSAATTSPFSANLASEWCDGGTVSCPSIDLSAYAGLSEVSIAFINKSGYSNNLYLDNFSVTGTRLVPLVISDSSITHVSCNGGSTGSVGVTIGGGISPYSYLWSNGATTSSISGLSAGTYGVTVTDQNSTQVSGSYTLTEPSALSASASSTNESVLGYADGTVTTTVTGGVAPYSYLWSNGQTGASLSGLGGGTYTVTVTDQNSCTTTASASVNAGVDTLKISNSTVTHLSCYQDNTGSITVSVAGGTTPYSYAWSNGATTGGLSGLLSGSYILTVSDVSGQQVIQSFTVTEPSELTLNVSGTDETIVGQNNGTASVVASGGTGAYTYAWSNGATTSTLTGLSPATYTLTVTDANNCSKTGSYTVAGGASILSLDGATTTNLTCNNDASGSISLSISGGTTPYIYSWSNGASTATNGGLDAGPYTVTVSDQSGQQVTGSYTLTEPTLLSSMITKNNESVAGANDGSASVVASGGTGTYSYAWSNGATTASISGLSPGSYTFTVTDANLCTTGGGVTINSGVTALSIASSFVSNLNCYQDASGSAGITLTGGTTPYSYLWSNGATTASITGLSAGTYTVTASDQSGQQVTGSYTLTEPTALTVTPSSTNESIAGASDGAASVVAAGGTSPYSYAWSNGATTASISGLSSGSYTYTVTDANLCEVIGTATIAGGVPVLAIASSSVNNLLCYQSGMGSAGITLTGGTTPYSYLWSNGATTASISGLSAGTYTVTASDQSGQQVTGSYTLTEPTALAVSPSSTNESIAGANDGAASVVATGGTSPYSYAWSNGATTASISGLSSGSHTYTVTDANLCEVIGTATIAGGVPVLAIASSSVNNLLCYQSGMGSAGITLTGGTTPYSYIWSNGATTASISGLSAGTYTVTASDQSGQQVTGSYTLTEPTALAVTPSSTNESIAGASDGSASVVASGGTSPYSFAWSNGATTASISGLAPGNYTFTVTDANLCTVSGGMAIAGGVPVLAIASSQTSNLLCYQSGMGSAGITLAGGTTPYSYIWSNGATTASISGLSAGTYTVTASDQSGQQVTGSYTLTEPTALAVSPSSTNESIAGASDGSASVVASGGTSPYSYAWSNGATTASISNLAPGNYTFTVTDANLCNVSGGVAIAGGVAVLAIASSQNSNLNCFQDASGSAGITLTGGTTPYSYIWSNGATTASISGLSAGTYTVTASDQSGQLVTGSYTLTEPIALSGLLAVNNQTVVSQNDGSIDALIQGGTPFVTGAPYLYAWSNGGSTSQIMNLSPGTYTLTVTDSLGCSITFVDSVETGADLMNIVGLIQVVSCAGGNDGAVDAQIIGGQQPYNYLWSTGATTQDVSNLSAGIYTLSASDAVGQTDVQNFLVAEPLPLITTTGSQDETVQGYANGSVSANASGGNAPYNYAWSNGSTGSNLSNLAPGMYYVTVTDAKNCSQTDSAWVGPGVPVLQWTIATTPVWCNGGANGAIQISTSGGAAPVTFVWSNGTTGATLNNLIAGTYAVTATDALGQTLDSVLVIQEPSALSVAFVITDESVQGVNDGALSAAGSGGTGAYTYSWSNGGTSASINNLAAGVYTLTLTDSAGCVLISTATVGTGVPVLSVVVLDTMVSCFGAADGAITLQISGGGAPIQTVWSTGDTTSTISGLMPGVYGYTVSDAVGQQVSGSATITEPAVLALSTVVTDESIQGLQDGSVSVLVNGGTSPYQYLWSNGLTMSTLNNLGPGYYTCTVTDANGCGAIVGDTVFDGIPLLQEFTTYLHPACYGDSSGSISVAASGGVPPYSWSWNTGDSITSLQGLTAGLYVVTLTDQSGQSVVDSTQLIYPFALSITGSVSGESVLGYSDGSVAVSGAGGLPPYSWAWSTGASGDSIYGLMGGVFTVTLTDYNNCTLIDSFVVGSGVDTLQLSLTGTNPACFGGSNGSINLTVLGGSAPFTYQWSQGSIVEDPANLQAGLYYVTVTDALNQLALGSILLSQPSALQASISVGDETVAGYQDGTASAAVSGGTPPYAYLWSNGATADSIGALSAGVYGVTVTDSLGCSTALSDTVFTGVPILQSTVQGQNILCFGGTTGFASIAVVGGAPPYQFLWSNGATSASITSVATGTYTYTVTDGVGQTATGNINLTEPLPLSAPATVTNETVMGQNDGSLGLAPTGGTATYALVWSTGSSANPLTGLAPGDYTYTLTDANGCTLSDTLTILAGAPLLSVTGTVTNESCANNGDGAIQLTVSGGLTPYSFAWSNGATSSGISGLSAGTYAVSVTDGSGQLFTGSYTVAAPAALVLSGTTSQPTTFGAADGSISLAISGGTPGYVFSWSDGSSLSSRVGLAAGNYAVTVTDNQGCSATGSWVLSDPAPPALSHSLSVVDVSCFDGADGSATVSAVGGVGPYSIVWGDGSTNFVINGLQAGSYGFTVSDGAGQQSSGVAIIAQPSALSVQAYESTPGSLYAVVSGGTYPYTYSWSTSPALTDSAISVPMGAEYEVVVTDANGCMADAFVTSTLSEQEWTKALQIYPNPGSDVLTILATGVQLEGVRIRDMSGRIVFEESVHGERQLLIRTSSWAAGSYSIQIQTPSGNAVVKWMLSR